MVLPLEFQERMKLMLGTEYEDFVSSYDREHSQGLRINLLKADKAGGEQLPFTLTPVPWAEEGYYYSRQDRPGRHPYHEAGVYYIQEPSAMAVAAILAPKPGESILDLCAAPGGKTSHIASHMKNQGLLISNEIHPARAKILSQNVERMGIRNAVVTNEDSGRLAAYFPEFFDRIAVDAPCSGEGMFRKDETARREWSSENVALCSARQQEILKNAERMLKPGGYLVYSTCTFAPEENEKAIEAFIEAYPGFGIQEIFMYPGFDQGNPEWSCHKMKQLERTVRIWPQRTGGEGHFIALLKKQGEAKGRRRKFPSYIKDKKVLKEYETFVKASLRKPDLWIHKKELILFGDQLYALPAEMLSFDKLKVVRPGLHLGTLKKNRFEPSHALALALLKGEATAACNFPADSPQIAAYLKGEVLDASCLEEHREAGWILITVDGYSLGWAKLAAGSLKNHYPKGLRR